MEEFFNPNVNPHRRFNPLNNEWVLVCPHRALRPWKGQRENHESSTIPQFDENNPLCPGVKRPNGQINLDYKSTYIFDNDFPALLPIPEVQQHSDLNNDDLFKLEPVFGSCKVMCFHPHSNLTLSTMSCCQILTVINEWINLMKKLASDYLWVQIFENKGSIMGCSNPHPHCQIWSSTFLPHHIEIKDKTQMDYFKKHGRPMLCDYVNKEISKKERIVLETSHWIVLVPFWAIWPYETMLIPKRHVLRLPDLTDIETTDLAEAMKMLLVKYDNLFETSFPYSMGWHQAPTGNRLNSGSEEHWQLHAIYLPPLLRSASIKKFMVGYELLANAQRDITAEQAAKTLSSLSNRHYLEKGN